MSALSYLSLPELRRVLAIRDLTDPSQGPHAMQLLLDAIHAALPTPVEIHRASPIVSIADNYDRLGYPADGAARDARYSRYVCDSALLRTQTSAMIPPLLRRAHVVDDVVLSCPGLVYRRDAIDRLHVGEPHQVDLWRIARRQLTREDLHTMIDVVVGAALPGTTWRTQPAEHPYTTDGLQIDASIDSEWIEIGECGLASHALVSPPASGVAIGLGLDRLLMLRKRIPDIRLLRASDPRIASQLLDLEPYHEVSMMPAVKRDLSIVLDATTDPEALGDRVREALGDRQAPALPGRAAMRSIAQVDRGASEGEQIDRAALVESIELVSQTAYAALPAAAIERLGIAPGQVNALVRVTLRALDRSLTHAECNDLRDDIYRAIHRGSVWQWATRPT